MNSKVIRKREHAQLIRPHWSNSINQDESNPANLHAEAIGYVVTSFNSLELVFRTVVAVAAGLSVKTVEALLTHVGNNTLSDALRALATLEDCDIRLREEYQFCAEVFDICRSNRNLVVHCSTYSPMARAGNNHALLTRRSARKKVEIKHTNIPLHELRDTVDSAVEVQEYFSMLVGPISKVDREKPLQLPDQPNKPNDLRSSSWSSDFLAIMGIKA